MKRNVMEEVEQYLSVGMSHCQTQGDWIIAVVPCSSCVRNSILVQVCGYFVCSVITCWDCIYVVCSTDIIGSEGSELSFR